MWDLSSQTRDWNFASLHWKCKVLTTDPPRKSQSSRFTVIRFTKILKSILDSVGEGEGGMWCFERAASRHVYYLGWNRSPAQVRCMRQVLGPGALGRARGIGWSGRWEGGSGRGTHVNPWLIHVNVWQKPLQYCKVISLQLIKINEKKFFWSLPTLGKE